MKNLTYKLVALLVFLTVFLFSVSAKEGTKKFMLKKNKLQKEITVTGTSSVSQYPDTLSFSISVSCIDKTTSDALSSLNKKINTIYNILQTEGIDKKSATLSTLSLSPYYEWNDNKREFVGQKAYQDISVVIDTYTKDSDKKVGAIIDKLSSVDSINISSFSYDIKDKSELYKKARQEAVKDAISKIEDYLSAAGYKDYEIIKIQKSGYSALPILYKTSYASNDMNYEEKSTEIVAGVVEVSDSVEVVARF